MKSFSQFLDCLIEDELFEGGLSRVYAHTQGRNIGMMTAFRGKDDFPGKSDEEVRKINHARNAELEHPASNFLEAVSSPTDTCTSTNSHIGVRNRKWIDGKYVEFPYDTKEYCPHGHVAYEYPLWYVVEYGYHAPDEVYDVIKYGDWKASQIGLKEGETHIRYYRDVPDKLKEPFEVRRKSANKKELRLIRRLSL
jgi:hypothetical protein